MYATKEEAKKAFSDLLNDRGISSAWTWDKVKYTIFGDARFNALKKESEKKQVRVLLP